MNTNTASKFEVGTIYTTGEARDYVWRFRVTRRTARFITIVPLEGGEARRVGIQDWSGVESAMPLGSYSMAPWIKADEPYRLADRRV